MHLLRRKTLFPILPKFCCSVWVSCLPPLHNNILLGNRWHCASDKKKIGWLLYGISTANFQIIVRLFQLVQSFILLSFIASVSCCVCVLFFIYICFGFILLLLCVCVLTDTFDSVLYPPHQEKRACQPLQSCKIETRQNADCLKK